MNVTKFFIALALFVSSVSYEQQVIQTKNGLDVSWSVSVSTSQSFALAQAMEMQNY